MLVVFTVPHLKTEWRLGMSRCARRTSCLVCSTYYAGILCGRILCGQCTEPNMQDLSQIQCPIYCQIMNHLESHAPCQIMNHLENHVPCQIMNHLDSHVPCQIMNHLESHAPCQPRLNYCALAPQDPRCAAACMERGRGVPPALLCHRAPGQVRGHGGSVQDRVGVLGAVPGEWSCGVSKGLVEACGAKAQCVADVRDWLGQMPPTLASH